MKTNRNSKPQKYSLRLASETSTQAIELLKLAGYEPTEPYAVQFTPGKDEIMTQITCASYLEFTLAIYYLNGIEAALKFSQEAK